uniref:Uncharacterized protein n=1 Tax=Mus spicilegus TaxID=10103 RepID=A0A8C6HH38_MUSSI
MQYQQRNIGYFNHLKADSRNITYSMTFSTKSSNRNFIIFLNEVQAAIIGHERCDLLAIFNELHPDTLPDGRIWLFDLNSYFFQHNSLCMRVGFLVLFIMPLLVLSVTAELPGSSETTTLSHLAGATGPRESFFVFCFCLFVCFF